jgi:hypothetical protein
MRFGEISATILSIWAWWRETSEIDGEAEDAAWALMANRLAMRPAAMRRRGMRILEIVAFDLVSSHASWISCSIYM